MSIQKWLFFPLSGVLYRFESSNPADVIAMDEQRKRKIWMAAAILLLAVCIVQGIFIVKGSRNRTPSPDIFGDPGKFSSFLDRMYQKEKNDSRDLLDHFFNDDFFSSKADPFKEMERLHRQMEDMMGSSRRNRFNDSWKGWFGGRFSSDNSEIAVKMKEQKDSYLLTVTIPNLKENHLNINIEEDGIDIEGEFSQSIERKDSAGNILGRHEMRQKLSKRIPIPDDADYSKAKIDTGKDKITVRIPKKKS